ncbi:DUF429 domain-containing protein [Actinomadura madurae]|uniref:DUF429 domain-containing protein n=1 Tax=Actinomadura madurae TaxID=1993 RepID=UPI0020261C6E|nr:DUF429 domain-containing protein [Actinomadura madurae]MCP9951825.1 DUF429 domain-containing protein [Actinomadura madurae]MCP9968597.1 DUF429 domain-containing protein [Actinomadura madurae]MCP9981070.1 DUF429 domain-containing protein [Actinomadura madurae]MCQ0007435.1 DUF429 domain-containing protein [Actinomadura madurae]MCQ0017263.1 DUF429 domain-containing protein [Actinomadura madurae]
MADGRVLGVDACASGWIGIGLREGDVRPYFAASIVDLVTAADQHGEVGVIAVDMPIGLSDEGFRDADLEARKALGTRRSSIFITPVRAAFDAATHARASEINRRITGKGISIQAFALKPKVLEVDQWVRKTGRRVVEVHPELSFAEMAGRALPSKTRWAGVERRRELLEGVGIVLKSDLGEAGEKARVDDVLDAAAAAWTARRVAEGRARCIPESPQSFSDGLTCAIWV